MTDTTALDRRQLLFSAGAVGLAAASCAPVSAQSQGPDLSGTSVLITGCSSGFGRLSAEHLAERGAQVFATMRNLPRTEADELRDVASSRDLDITVLELDVRSDAQVEGAVGEALRATDGALDVLVNNAGIAYAGPVEMQDMEATQHLFDTNLIGPHRTARAVLPAMRERGRGLIVNVSSQLGRVIIPAFGQYSPTKFALEAMSEAMAMELAPFGIDVSIVQPGGYPTEIWDNARALTADLLARTPESLRETYAAYLEGLDSRGGGSSDPMDIPRALADIIAAPRGTRPLRVPVHPDAKPQLAINAASAATQKAMLERMGRAEVARKLYG